MMKKTKVLIIGLDGATWKLLDPWVKKGILPFLSNAAKLGSRGITNSTIPPMSAPAWVTFQTGVNPGSHGVFDFYFIDKNGKKHPVSSDNIALPPFWEIMNRHGKRSIIVNMPVTYPVKPGDDVVVSSFLTPIGENYAYPPRAQRLLERIGYQIDLPFERYGFLPDKSYTKTAKVELYEKLLYIARTRKKAVELLSKEYQSDLIFVLFKETDLIQHLFWEESKILEFYIELDKLIGSLVNNIKKTTNSPIDVIILSDHGFHKSPSWRFLIIRWLNREGFLKGKTELTKAKSATLYQEIKKIGLDLGRFTPLEKLKKSLKQRHATEAKESFRKDSPIWATHWGLYVRSTDPKLIGSLISKLKKVKFKNKRVFQGVYQREDIYKGSVVNRAPQIILMPSEEFIVDADPLYHGEIISPIKLNLQGHHYADRKGILIAYGPNIRRGKNIKIELSDFAPTILSLQDISVTHWMEGEARRDFLTKSKVRKKKQITYPFKRTKIEKMIDGEIKSL